MRDDGILTFYTLTNTAQPGRMPVEQLVSSGTAYYSRLNIGVTRMYAAFGANHQIDALVRCHNTPSVPSGSEYVIVNNMQYRIDAVQERPERDAVDLTLVRLGDNFNVNTEQT